MTCSVFFFWLFQRLPPMRWMPGGLESSDAPTQRSIRSSAAAVLDGQRLDLLSSDLQMLQTDEAPHAVIHVDHVVPGGQLREALQRYGSSEAAAAADPARSAKDLVVVEHSQRCGATGEFEPGR